MPSQQFMVTTRDLRFRSLLWDFRLRRLGRLVNHIHQVGCHPWCTYQLWLRCGLATQVFYNECCRKNLGKSISKYPTTYWEGVGWFSACTWRVLPIFNHQSKVYVRRIIGLLGTSVSPWWVPPSLPFGDAAALLATLWEQRFRPPATQTECRGCAGGASTCQLQP